MNEEARVVAKEDGLLWLVTQRQTSCGTCAAKKGCSQKVLAELGAKDAHYIKVDQHPEMQANVGDIVEIMVPGEAIVKGSLQIYSLPLLTMIVGAAIGDGYAGDGGAIAAAIIGFCAGLWVSKKLINQDANCRRLQPEIVAVRPGLVTTQAVEVR
ncbi:Protein RseC [Sinobacterium norvegicum]|uniref:Protein RseC n=1 Tax=Sinobacterium norvegicum TaxID=1641715 RepID=A0ABN8ED87_9GAMM|nr:SoxR reducing system RseC family protein [Sinobacterium norvegicum]CAH0990419.1 Protein RseC [Sinobacterium norvegicum]